jgi:Large polyvalent protein-associated domain 3
MSSSLRPKLATDAARGTADGRRNAARHAGQELAGFTLINQATQLAITLAPEALATATKPEVSAVLLNAIPEIPCLLSQARYVRTAADPRRRGDVRRLYILATEVELAGRPAELLFVVRETRNGQCFLDRLTARNACEPGRQDGGGAPDATLSASTTENSAPFMGSDYSDWYKPPRPVDTLRFPNGSSVINPITNQPLIMPAGVSIEDNIAAGKDNYTNAVNSVDQSQGESYLNNEMAAEIARMRQMYGQVARGKPMDYQRSGGRFDATFKPFSSYNYGAVARAAGYSLDEALMAAGIYNWLGTTGRNDGVYGNDPDNAQLIEQGWNQQPLFAPMPKGN